MEEEEQPEQPEQLEQGEVDDNQSSTDDASDAPRATATKRTSLFDQALETHRDRNVRAKFAKLKAAETDLQEALDTYESTKSVEAKKRAINAMLKQLEPKTTEVASSSRTNREEVNGTAKFLRWFMEHHEDLLPYYTIYAGKRNDHSETMIKGPHNLEKRFIDLNMVPDNPRNWVHHRIEFKEKDPDKAHSQCCNYARWGLPTGKVAIENTYTEWGPSDADTVMHVHAFFLDEPNLDIKDKFKEDGFGVLWPGQEHTLQFLRILGPDPSDEEE